MTPEKVCASCLEGQPSYDSIRSWGIYDDTLRRAIHRLKYYGDITLGEALSKPMIDIMKKVSWELDFVVPVPSSSERKSLRGYNQASLLALPIALALGIPYQPKALRKIKETRSQVGLSIEERYANVEKAFAAEPVVVVGKIALVVDDVITSGATMQVCARTLKEAGATAVFGVSLARSRYLV